MVAIKGTVIIDTVRAVVKRDGEFKYAKILQRLDPETRSVLENRISPTSWYPLDAFVKFLAADINVTASGDPTVLIRRAEVVVEEQLRGVYRAFARLCSTEFFIQRLSAAHRTYFSGVAIDIQSTGTHRATVKYVGFEPQHQLVEYIVLGFFRKALALSGAKQIGTGVSVTTADQMGYWQLDLNWSSAAGELHV